MEFLIGSYEGFIGGLLDLISLGWENGYVMGSSDRDSLKNQSMTSLTVQSI